ncbi:MAG: nucleoside-diphosphate sugar epimerase/dehydratase [bacterium]
MPLIPIYKWTKGLSNKDFFVFDLFIILLTPFISLFVRYDGLLDISYFLQPLITITFVFFIIKMVVFYYLGLYKRLWNAASIDDLIKLIFIGLVVAFLEIAVFIILRKFEFLKIYKLPFSIPFIESLFSMIFVSVIRLSPRLFERAYQRINEKENYDRVLVVGAGSAGINVIQEMQRNAKLKMLPTGFIDDDIQKKNLKVIGVPILGTRKDIPAIVTNFHIQKIVIAIPSVAGKSLKEILYICKGTSAEVLTIPSLFDIIDGRIGFEKLRKVQIDDLLRREPIKTDIKAIFDSIKNRVVLVTGAGGSIGSEICRQVIRANPSKLILLGHGENSIFEVEEELKYFKTYNEISEVHSVICDIRFKDRLDSIFSQYHPDIIFHAAAHKHVPLMEMNPQEAITNNVFGTQNLVEMSIKYNVSRFIMISTDKAVNPTNIMGATKRICEMIVLDAAKKYNASFSVVRFGNVLGSRGSVTHTFNNQIKLGGPVTVTHPQILRFFMTIPESVQLVLQAFILGKGGEIFLFDMGEPHLISELAKDMIKLSGLELDKDIKIIYTGLRPGEKLFEEMFIAGESYDNTQHEKIFIARNASKMVINDFNNLLPQLYKASLCNDRKQILDAIKSIVEEYKENGYIDQLELKKLDSVKGLS